MRQESGVKQQRQTAPERVQSLASTARWVIHSGPPGTVMSSPSAIWAQGKKELDMVLACGFSRTQPKTIERQEEVTQVFSKHVIELGSLSAPESTRSDFIEIGLSAKLPFQGSFYLSLTTTDEATKDLPNLIRCFLPESISDPYDVKHILRTNATSRIGALTVLKNWLAHRVSLEHHDPPDALKQRIARDWYTYMRQRDLRVFDVLGKHAHDKTACNELFNSQGNLNGIEVTIKECQHSVTSRRLKYSITWKEPSSSTVAMDNLPLPPAAKPQGNEKRFIHFVPEGILIVNKAGQPIKASAIKANSRQAGVQAPPEYPTLSIELLTLSLTAHPHGKAFLELWKRQSAQVAGSVSPDTESHLLDGENVVSRPRVWTAGPRRGLPLCSSYVNSAKVAVQSLLPVHPSDSLWLIHKFLQSQYPAGGLVRCSNPAKDLSGESVFTKLLLFLETLPYSRHPFAGELLSLARLPMLEGMNSRKATSTIKSALDVLRGQTQISVNKTLRVESPTGGQKVNIAITQIWINARAPAQAIALVETEE